MIEITLERAAIIAGETYRVGDTLTVGDIETINRGYAAFEKTVTRLMIEQNAGDTLSLLGTTSDAVALLTIMQCIHVTALANSTTFAAYKTAYETELDKVSESADSLNAVGTQCADLLSQIASKAVVFPYSVKYATAKVAAVFTDVAQRATAAAHHLVGRV